MNWLKSLFRKITLAERVARDIDETERELYGARRRRLLEDWHVRYYEERLKELRMEQKEMNDE
ncbi:MAG: hypothetical protein AB7U98_13735 [Candidatus Nitrosocosmicus sp.]